MRYKKISNNADRKSIEKQFGRVYKYPKLYQANPLIDGSTEQLLSIITMGEPEQINFAIWGLLPEDFNDEWIEFQEVRQTLHIPILERNQHTMFDHTFEHQRCLIIITGFFIYHLHEGTIYPYYVYNADQKPFCMAGVYTVLQDGFITCSILTTKATGVVEEIQNMDPIMPLILPGQYHNSWLDSEVSMNELQYILHLNDGLSLKAHPIAKEFFKNDISYDSMLEPVFYKDLPAV